ncbi:MAG: MBL fold metallo-hydrolase [Ruminiclostridium sp.]
MKLHFLKTKWSDIIILQRGDEVALVDTGFDEQYEQVRDYLSVLGTGRISFILLTHFHRDHYGNIPNLITDFKVDTVYMKRYSGLDCTTAWGTEADDAYRHSETDKFNDMVESVSKKSRLVFAEDISAISFGRYELKLFSTENSIKEIYEDKSCPETYHRIALSENQNSLAVLIKADGKNIFLGGDVMDYPSPHPKADHVCCRIARSINEQIDIYKAPHHGTVHTACEAALSILRPRTAIITNEDTYLKENSDIYDNLRKANPDVKILLTEKENIIIDTE